MISCVSQGRQGKRGLKSTEITNDLDKSSLTSGGGKVLIKADSGKNGKRGSSASENRRILL